MSAGKHWSWQMADITVGMCYQLFLTSGGSGGGNKSHGSHEHHHNKEGHKSKNHGASNTTEEGRGYFGTCTYLHTNIIAYI